MNNYPLLIFVSCAIVSYIYMEILYFRKVRPFLEKRHIEPQAALNNFGRFTDYRKAKEEVKKNNLNFPELNHIRVLFIIYIGSFIGIATAM